MDKQDKIYVFITGMLLLLMATFASCAKADQQGFDEFVSSANVKMMIKNKHPEWLKNK